MTIADEIKDTKMGRPHVVILGAGASAAAFPSGDKNGRRLPVLNDLIHTLELDSVFASCSIDFVGRNFEDIYSDLVTGGGHLDLVRIIQDRVSQYFEALELPEKPTLYDYLVLSLRPKDIIATFNWDPFLFRACSRNYGRVPLPRIVFLHGNVAVGYCEADRVKGINGGHCFRCGKPYKASQLLFPVKQKNYNSDPLTSAEWETLKARLRNAYMVTVFGYSAPKTDVEAISLLKEGWGRKEERNLEQIEIIDIRPEDDLLNSWEEFIHTHHYQITNDYHESWIAKHPRRTCEAMWNQLMECNFLDDNPAPQGLQFGDLLKWFQPFIEAEEQNRKSEG